MIKIVRNQETKTSRPCGLLEYHTGSCMVYELRIPAEHAKMRAPLPPFKDVDELKVECYRLLVVRQEIDNTNALVLVKFPNDNGLYGIDIFLQGGADWNPHYKKSAYKASTPLDRRIVMGFCINYSCEIHNISTYRQTYYSKLRDGKGTGDKLTRFSSLVELAYTYTYKGIKERYQRGPNNTVHYPFENDELHKAVNDYINNPRTAKFVSVGYDGFPSHYDFMRDVVKFDTIPHQLSGTLNGTLRF